MLTLKQITGKYGVPYRTLYYWIKQRKLNAVQGINRFNVNEWYVSEDDWLNVPTFIRNRYKKRYERT